MPPPMINKTARIQTMRSCDAPRAEMDLPVERGGQPFAVGHHQETAAGSRHQVARQRQHVIGGRLVQIAGGLVGQQQQRFYRERAAIATRCCCPPDNCSG